MRLFIVTLCTLISITLITAQSSHRTKLETPVPVFRSVDLRTIPSRDAFIQYQEQPKPGGKAYHEMLQMQKVQASARFPETTRAVLSPRSAVDPPELVRSFSGNGFPGIPLDNHLAVNRQDQVVSVVNTHMIVTGPTGIWLKSYSLDDFWSALGEQAFYFDPRVIYDPLEDRYIIAMMQDFDCGGSNIVFAFSATSDPIGVWHMYQFEGCPNANATFADYPMIALTQDELFFTYNAVYQDSSWQTGFNETLIYQINKFDGYTGEDLRWRSWSEVRHDNRLLRYMCPVKFGNEDMSSDIYLLSTRSFDIQNDTVFMVHINGNLDQPDLDLTIQPLISDRIYGVPPNARQPMDFLQTNDARVLDAFYVEDHIQFVANTMDPGTGRCAVYHGMITDVTTAPVLSSEYLHNGTEHFGYPGISYTGILPGDRDAIIIASHTSADRFPGYSALYFNEGYSEWIPVKEGARNIDMFKINNPFGVDPTLERWGDYSGIQRQYNEIGTVYTSSSYGKPGSVNDTWVGYLKRPEKDPTATSQHPQTAQMNAYPNPADSWVTVELEVEGSNKLLSASLLDQSGRKVRDVMNSRLSESGQVKFFFDTSKLASGAYVLQILVDGRISGIKHIIVD
jgi:hypothetical protein